MPPKQRKSIIATRGQKRKQAENPTPKPRNNDQTHSSPNAQSPDSTDELGELKRQVRQLMESQGQIMGMLQGTFLNHQGAAPHGSQNTDTTEESEAHHHQMPRVLQAAVNEPTAQPATVNPIMEAVTEIVGTGTHFTNPDMLVTDCESIPPNLVYKKSNPIGTRVPRKLKDKIVTDQYVDMAALLDLNPQVDSMSQEPVMYVQVAHNVVRPIPRKKNPQVLDISQWVKAFHLFMAIYTKVHPHEAPNLLQYLMVVESIAEEKGDWRVYDETFRFERAESKTPWERLDNELYTYVTRKAEVKLAVTPGHSGNSSYGPQNPTQSGNTVLFDANHCLASGNLNGGSSTNFQTSWNNMGGPFRQQGWFGPGSTPRFTYQLQGASGNGNVPRSGQSSSFPHPRGTCWNFQDGKFCNRSCGFTHECGHCGGSHPSNRCWNGQAGTAGHQESFSYKPQTPQATRSKAATATNSQFPKGSNSKARSSLAHASQ